MISWPSILGAHPRIVDSFRACDFCGAGTFVAYAGSAFCATCASHPEARRWLEYRITFHLWLRLESEEADQVFILEAHQQLVRLTDEIGGFAAEHFRRRWARAWYRERGSCPYCGGPEFHDFERERKGE